MLLRELDSVVRSQDGWRTLRRIGRYFVTSGLATVLSEAALLACYASGALGATSAAVVANLAGAIPSYLLSRYWIWPEADRAHVGRQVGLYWMTSLVSTVVSTATTGFAGYLLRGMPDSTLRDGLVGLTYVGTYGLLWLAKFVVYQRVVFRGTANGAPTAIPTAEAWSREAPSRGDLAGQLAFAPSGEARAESFE